MITDKDLLLDQFSTLEGGMNSNMVYSLLPKTQASLLVNATCRNGLPECRPGFKPKSLKFATGGIQTAFQTGKFQGAGFYQGLDGINSVIASISGRLFQVRLSTLMVTEITIPSDRNSAFLDRAYFQQAEEFLIIQDGQSKATIFNGAICRRSNPAAREVPTGTVMAYGMGRLWVAMGRNYVAGDIVGGPTSVISFTENTYIAGGGSFTVPLQSGNITAMSFIANLDTSLGQGALIIFTVKSAYSVQVPLDRAAWATTTNPIATVAQMNFGSISNHITPVNGDLFYRSKDGIRSLIIGVRYFGQWGNVPISIEMTNPLAEDNPILATFASSILLDNRLLMTAVPQKSPRGTIFLGLIALDFNPISSIRDPSLPTYLGSLKSPPAYDGIWTGLKWLQVMTVEGPDQGLAFVVNGSGNIDLWEMTTKERFDNGSNPIQWIIEGPGLNFGNSKELKELFYGDMWVDRLSGNVDFLVSYRPDHYAFFVDWSAFSKCGSYKDCSVSSCKVFSEPREQYRPRIRLPKPPAGCEDAINKPFQRIYEMQVRLQMTGFCRILGTRMFSRKVQEIAVGGCPDVEACSVESGCDKNPYSYSSN